MISRLFILAIIVLFNFSVFADSNNNEVINVGKIKELDQCSFFGEYAELFYNEKNIKGTPKEEVLNSIIFIIGQTEDYLNMDKFSQDAFNDVISDLANQVYNDDSSTLKEVKDKSIAYCEHNKGEINRTQSERIAYCQKKGENSELFYVLAGKFSEDEVLSTIDRLNNTEDAEPTIEYKNTVMLVLDMFKLYEANPNLDSAKVGEVTYRSCLANRG